MTTADQQRSEQAGPPAPHSDVWYERNERALELWRSGMSYAEIARRDDIDLGHREKVKRAVNQAKAREESLTVDEVRDQGETALVKGVRSLVRIIEDPSSKPDLVVRANMALATVVRERMELHGAKAPARRVVEIQQVSAEALAEDHERWRQDMLAQGKDPERLLIEEAEHWLAERRGAPADPSENGHG